ncbi:MAG TPA: protein translocase subunit SecF [Reyranella sp.]|nr:protein translocase subunit SecF [Reyranella sp.]
MRWPLIKYLPDKTNLAFVRPSRIFGVLSALAIAASLFFSIWPAKPPCGGLNCGVDFKGGTVLEMRMPSAIDHEAVRSLLTDRGLGDVQVQQIDSDRAALVRFETPPGTNPVQAVDGVKRSLQTAFQGATFERTEVVGPKISGELFQKGLWALLGAIGLMLVYIWFRFGLTFGIGAVAALFHDVILTFGLFAVTKLEFTLVGVAAILTIIGYSMNDTVVVLDRIRENLRKYKKMPLGELIDLSINETLSRTIITGITGLMALTGLAILGGEALRPFSIAMIFGIIVGTYSSIFVAAPVLLFLGVRREGEAEAIDLTKGTSVRPQKP